MNKLIDVKNTGEKIKNEFYLIELKDELKHNSNNKNEKIKNVLNFSIDDNFPIFLKRDLANIKVEQELEIYRSKHFSHLPSRCACLYVFQNFGDLHSAMMKYNWHGKIFKITIDTTKEYIVSKHNMEIISTLRDSSFQAINRNQILNYYWSGANFPLQYANIQFSFLPISEYLIEGEFTYSELKNVSI